MPRSVTNQPQLFRAQPKPGEVLAMDPKAFWFMFSMGRRDTELMDNGIAVLHVEGPLEHKAGWCWDSYESIVDRVREAAEDEDVRALVFKFDSPGGDVAGLNEAVAEIERIKEASGKPIYAYANELAASAAYALACAADEIWLPEAAGVGSIGVISVLAEMTERDKKEGYHFEVIASGERKPDGNPHIKISDGARKRCEKRIDTLAGMFFELVARSRGLSAKKVEAYEADVFFGQDAVQTRLADGVSSWPDFLSLVADDLNRLDKNPKPRSGSTNEPPTNRPAGGGGKAKTMGLLALRKKKDEAAAALASAKTEAAKKKATAAFEAAVRELASAEAAATEAKKMKKTKFTEETYEDDSDEDEDEEDDAEDDAEDGSAKDDAEDEEDAEDDAEDGKKAARGRQRIAARSGGGGGDFFAELAEITGKKSKAGVLGFVRAAAEGVGQIKKIQAELRSMKVSAMIDAGRKAGKIEKGMVAFCRDMGMKSPKQLSAYLAAKAPQVRTEEDGPLLPKSLAAFATIDGSPTGLTPEMAEIAERMGMTPEQAAQAAQHVNGKMNGTPTR